jgi:hypothetical protein
MTITIKDLKFKQHEVCPDGTQAVVKFKNGYGASIITGSLFYTKPGAPFEIAVLGKDGHITYSTPITDDVCGWLSEDAANEILKQIQELPINLDVD